jgi:hypothetical protein
MKPSETHVVWTPEKDSVRGFRKKYVKIESLSKEDLKSKQELK